MLSAIQNNFQTRQRGMTVRNTVIGSPRRAEAENYIADIFRSHYKAEVSSFSPNLMLVESGDRIAAAAGWRCAADEPLFLETYLDTPIEQAISKLAGRPVERSKIVEVGNLAADRRGGSIDVILTLAAHLDRLGFEWVVFTATNDLISIFRRLGLPPLALAPADPERLGDEATAWGSYYSTNPIVVAGRIRLALDKSAQKVSSRG